jgi:hypothetical protein
MLYMFRAVSPPIIGAQELYTQHLVRARLAAATASSRIHGSLRK